MKKSLKFLYFIIVTAILYSCDYELEEQENYFGAPGKMTIKGYVLSDTDSVRVSVNDIDLAINSKTIFSKKLETSYEFVSYYNNPSEKSIKVTNNSTEEVILAQDYIFSNPEAQIVDTLSFFYKPPSIFINDVLAFKQGKITQNGNVGFRFMFPNINYYSQGTYTGAIDAIITRFPSGEAVGTVENIEVDTFSDFIEFAYTSPPLIRLQLVKHGTTESYLPDGSAVTIDVSIQSGKSKLIVLEETVDADGNFKAVNASLDLTTYF